MRPRMRARDVISHLGRAIHPRSVAPPFVGADRSRQANRVDELSGDSQDEALLQPSSRPDPQIGGTVRMRDAALLPRRCANARPKGYAACRSPVRSLPHLGVGALLSVGIHSSRNARGGRATCPAAAAQGVRSTDGRSTLARCGFSDVGQAADLVDKNPRKSLVAPAMACRRNYREPRVRPPAR